jgi:hypothetical protein
LLISISSFKTLPIAPLIPHITTFIVYLTPFLI